MSETMYKLKGDYLALLYMLEDPDVDPEVIKDTLEAVKGEIEVKAEGYVQVIRQMEAARDARKTEGNRLIESAKVYDNGIKRLKTYIRDTMDELNIPKIETDLHTLSVQNSSGKRALWTDTAENIPDEYLKTVKVPDNDKIREYLESLPENVAVEWAHLEPRGRSLRIR